MRPHVLFALLVAMLVAVSGWVVWDDAFPEWRFCQRDLARREVDRLERELVRVRAELDRPENRYERTRLDQEIARADRDVPADRLEPLRMELDSLEARLRAVRAALREGDRRLREPALARRRESIAHRLERVQQAYARVSGAWPPDTLRLRILWMERDSLADALIRIEGPIQALKDSALAMESLAQQRRLDLARLSSVRDSLEMLRAALLEPVRAREAALDGWRRRRPGVREIASADGRVVARCPTCHGTMDDGPGTHPALRAMESFRDIPCTVCHLGRGRALTRTDAHRGLLVAGDFGAGPYSLPARIERLRSRDPLERARAREELWQITGIDPDAERGAVARGSGADSAAAVWAEWWRSASPFFEPGGPEGSGRSGAAVAIDPWELSTRGRPLAYVGSRKCLACHEVQNREHSRRWMATKFRSIERLAGEKDPRRCLPCHATGYDPASGAYAEPGVTCEACHGPGERYNEMMTAGQELIGKGAEARGRALLEIGARLAREGVSLRMRKGDRGEMNVCVSCHQPWQHRDGGPATLERAADVGGMPRPTPKRTGG